MADLILSIRAWVAEISQHKEKTDCDAESEGITEHGFSKADIEFVGTIAFSLPNERSNLESILSLIRSTFGDEIYDASATSLTVVAQVCLVFAVSNACAERTYFVRCIMNLEAEHQTNLMEIIQDNLQNMFTAEYITATSIAKVDSSSSSLVDHTGTDFDSQTGQYCSVCREKDELVKQLQKELIEISSREQTNDSKLKIELAATMNRLVDVELAVLERDKQLQVATKRLEESETKMNETEEFIRQQKDKYTKLELLRDEVDVLRPMAEKAEHNEKQIIRLREKLDELTDIKQQLKAESQAHEDTHSKLLLAEQELDSTRKYKVQVDEYRAQLTESSILLQDMTLRAKMRDNQILELRQQMEYLEAGNRGHFEEAQHLAGELQATC